jgi:hypothetical protein
LGDAAGRERGGLQRRREEDRGDVLLAIGDAKAVDPGAWTPRPRRRGAM